MGIGGRHDPSGEPDVFAVGAFCLARAADYLRSVCHCNAAHVPNRRRFRGFRGPRWPIFLNTAAGEASLPQRHRDNARILGLKPREYLWRIVFPSSLPHIFSGMSVGLVFSFIMLTVAELFGEGAGLGRFVQLYADYADYPEWSPAFSTPAWW